jgi:hypothetical protein
MHNNIRPEEFHCLAYHSTGKQFYDPDLPYAYRWFGKDPSKSINFKEFYDWWQSRAQLLQDRRAGRAPQREGGQSSGSPPGSTANLLAPVPQFRNRTASTEKLAADRADKRGSRELKDKRASGLLDDEAARLQVASRCKCFAAWLKPYYSPQAKRMSSSIDKDAYKKAMLEKYEAQQRENAELLRKKREEDSGLSSSGRSPPASPGSSLKLPPSSPLAISLPPSIPASPAHTNVAAAVPQPPSSIELESKERVEQYGSFLLFALCGCCIHLSWFGRVFVGLFSLDTAVQLAHLL